MKILKYSLIALSVIIAIVLLVPAFVFAILYYWILTPEYLTSATKEAISEYTYVDFDCKSIELDYLQSWPSISIAINEGEIGLPAVKDSLNTEGRLSFKKLYGNIQLQKLLTARELEFKNIFLDQPEGKIAIGTPNKSILKKEFQRKDTTKEKISFNINQIAINQANIELTHKTSKKHVELNDASVNIDGELTIERPSFNLSISCSKLTGRTIERMFGNEGLSFTLQGECLGTEKFKDITFSNTSFKINQFPFHLNGSIYNLYKKKEVSADLNFNLLASDLNEIMDFIPAQLMPEKANYQISGSTMLQGSIKGKLSGPSLPDLKLRCEVDKGSFYKKDIGKGIDTISLHVDMCYMEEYPDSCYIQLNDAKIKGLNSFIDAKSRISNLQESPFINLDINGFIDFDHIGEEYISPDVALLKGKLETNLSLAFNLRDMREQNLNRIWADGTFNTSFIQAQSSKYNFDIYAANMEASIGYKKNRSDFIENDEVLSAVCTIDTLKMQYDKSIFVNLSKLNMRSNTALSNHKDGSVPLTMHLDCNKLQAQLDKDRWIGSQDLSVVAGIKSISIEKKSEAACVIKADELQYIDRKEENAISLSNTEFITELHPAANNKWDIKGLVNIQGSQIYTSYYPIDIKSKQAHISFKNNQFSFNHVQLNVGESDCFLSGIITTNNQPKPNEPQVEGALHLIADYINYNELKGALLYHQAAQKEFRVSNMQNFQISELQSIIEDNKYAQVQDEPFYIPKGVELSLNLNINNMLYEELDLTGVNGEIYIKEQKAHTNLSTRTSLGKAKINALYDSADKKNINTKLDVQLQDVLIAQIHNVLPTVNTLFPMLSSMDGLVNCQLSLASQLDNQMFPVISTTRAALSLDGQNLTLMDNELFQKVASKLLFKNKKKNKIDQLSTNIILQDNVIEVIPFQVKWDRYEAIIGGTHTTDYTFDYHVTLLKSPIPVDFGVNISGKTDNMDYKVGKCKYKKLYKDNGKAHNQTTKARMNRIRTEIVKDIKL